MRNFLLKFIGVGGTATAIQYLILVSLASGLRLDPVFSSAVGFAASSIFNYYANYAYTFASSQAHAKALPKFYAMVLGGLLINSLAMYVLADALSINYLLAQLTATIFVFIFNFTVSWLWVFR